MRLGDWLPPCPLQGISLDHIAPGLYHMRDVGIMGPKQNAEDGGAVDIGSVAIHIDPMPEGVAASVSVAPSWDLAINCTEDQARTFAAYYGGVTHVSANKIIIKAIANGMRKEAGNAS